MFHAELISLSDGQSYENVRVCEDVDLDKYNVPRIFENWTGLFFADGKAVVFHHWKIKVIHLYRDRRGSGSIRTSQLILDGDISYSDCTLISPSTWAAAGIPEFFVKRGGIAGQFAWSCPQGTFITHDTNVTSVIIPDPRPKGITSATQPGVDSITPKQVIRASTAPDTVHGKVEPREPRFGQ